MCSNRNPLLIIAALCGLLIGIIIWESRSLDGLYTIFHGSEMRRKSNQDLELIQPVGVNYAKMKFHLLTALMTIRSDSMVNKDRKSESGMWLTKSYFLNITKTLYHIDYYHKHVDKIIPRERTMQSRGVSQWKPFHAVFFNSILLNTPNLRIIPLANPAQSQECGFFLQYIVDHYHNLADYSIFLHGNPVDHNPHIFEQLEWFFTLPENQLRQVSFLHLNCQEYVQRRYTKAGWLLDSLGFDVDTFTSDGNLTKEEISQGMRYFASQCCAQFIVSSNTIRRRPLSFWQVALKVTLDHRNFCNEWEYMWHAIFLGIQTLPQNQTINFRYQTAHPNFISKCPNKFRADQV